MSNRALQDLEKSFPFREEFRDHSGCAREFEISLHTVHGEVFGIVANEVSQVEGYRFDVGLDVCSMAAIGLGPW